LYAQAQPLDDKVIIFSSTTDAGEKSTVQFPLDTDTLLHEAQKGGFFSYVAGVAYRISVNHQVGGIRIDNYRTTLPLGKGLSSSAAVCVLVARAFNRVYGLQLTVRGEMEYAYLGEVTTPSKCGRMDQACAYGALVAMSYDADILRIAPASLAVPLHMVLVDLKAAKDTTAILQGLQRAYPTASDDKSQALQQLLGDINLGVCERALAAMAAGDLPGLGALMREAQSEFDARAGPMCPEQLTAPVLHKVLTYAPIQGLIHGAKGVGSQGDGTAQILCKDAGAQAAVCRILSEELGMGVMPLTVPATH